MFQYYSSLGARLLEQYPKNYFKTRSVSPEVPVKLGLRYMQMFATSHHESNCYIIQNYFFKNKESENEKQNCTQGFKMLARRKFLKLILKLIFAFQLFSNHFLFLQDGAKIKFLLLFLRYVR